jgi:hypothetical protein
VDNIQVLLVDLPLMSHMALIRMLLMLLCGCPPIEELINSFDGGEIANLAIEQYANSCSSLPHRCLVGYQCHYFLPIAISMIKVAH